MKISLWLRPAPFCFGVLISLTAGLAFAQPEATLVSGRPFVAGNAANGESLLGDVTPDGRFVAVGSVANNLRAGLLDLNRTGDCFVLDRSSGDWQLISHRFGAPTISADRYSVPSAISPDGRFVLLWSGATNLIATPQDPAVYQIYLYDRSTATTTLISHRFGQPEVGVNSGAIPQGLSADGRFVFFSSDSHQVIPGSGSPQDPLFLHDGSTGVTVLVSHSAGSPTTYANGVSWAGELSADGRFALFSSVASDMVAGTADSANTVDTFLYDRNTGGIELISHRPDNSSKAMGGAARDLSADGRYVLLNSLAPLQAGMTDANGREMSDCFLYDRQSGTARLVSHSAASTSTGGLGDSNCVGMSDDAAFIYFWSYANDLIPSFIDNNLGADFYRFDLATGDVTLVSHSATAANSSGNGATFLLHKPVSPDGRYLLYKSEATDVEAGITDTNGVKDLFLYDRTSNSSTLLSRRGAGTIAEGSNNIYGESTAFDGTGSVFFDNLESLDADPAADFNYTADVYTFTPTAGQVVPLSVAGVSGRQALGIQTASLSEHGRWVLWAGWIYDLITGSNELIGHAAGLPQVPANREVNVQSIDAGSRFVLLDSEATDLVTGLVDGPYSRDVFIYDRTLKTASLVSRVAGSPMVAAESTSASRWLSEDGQRLILESSATTLLPGVIGIPNVRGFYFYDRPADQMTPLAHRHDSPLQWANATVKLHGISSDERFLLFTSRATDLVAGFVDTNGSSSDDIYLFDRLSSQATLISHQAGFPAIGGNGRSSDPIPNGDFRYVFFSSAALDLVAGAGLPPGEVIYRWDRLTGANQIVTSFPSCHGSFGNSLQDVSLDGRLLLVSTPCGLLPGDTNGTADVYLFDRITAQYELISHVPGNPQMAKGNSKGTQLSDDGRRVTYTDLGGNGGRHGIAYDRQTKQEIDLRVPAYFDGTLLGTRYPQASRDGNRILLGVDDNRAVPFDANRNAEALLIDLSRLFSDGFESGDTTAWSSTVSSLGL